MRKIRWLILGLTFIICIAVYVNWDSLKANIDDFNAIENGSEDNSADKVLGDEIFVSDSYFEMARYTRKKTRDEAITVLNTLVSNEKADPEARLSASDDISSYAQATEKESIIESLISSKGFGESIAFIGKDNASVVVSEKNLSVADAAQIIDIVVSETGLKAAVVKIIELNSVNQN